MCHDCLLIQLAPGEAPAPEEPGPIESQTALRHAAASAQRIVDEEHLKRGSTVLELDSSHGGSWLHEFTRLGLREVAHDRSADLVVDVHHLMHAEDLRAILRAHSSRLAPGGVVVCEFFHALPMVSSLLIDTVRHGHFSYLTLLAARDLWRRHGLTVTRAREVPAYGGSLQVTARHSSESPRVDISVQDVNTRERAAGLDRPDVIRDFGARGLHVARRLHRQLVDLRAQSRSVAAYGAPSKAAVLLSLAGIDQDLLPYTVDLSPAKHGRRIPGAGVPIAPVGRLFEDQPDNVVILTWDIADEIAEQLSSDARSAGWRPTLYAPLPQPRSKVLGEPHWYITD
jgi:hypothetical protein